MFLLSYMWGMKKISTNTFYQGAPIKNIFLGNACKLEKDGPIFSIFSPYPSLPSVATDRDRKQFQSLNMDVHNKTGPLVSELNWCEMKTI